MREKDEEVVKVVEEIKRAEVRNLKDDEWEIEGDLVLKKGKIYIPNNEELRIGIIQLHYDILVIRYRER